jgi:hypothetical protein
MWEMPRAISELKNTAPGMTGAPSKAWKTLVKDEDIKRAMLAVLQNFWKEEKVPLSWLEF